MPEQLPEVIQALLNPQIYPERTAKVDLIQTQMSFVLLTGKFVYKVKKAINLGYVDYTTLEKRHYFCKQEVELNRRLSPEAYLGVVPITPANPVLLWVAKASQWNTRLKCCICPRIAC